MAKQTNQEKETNLENNQENQNSQENQSLNNASLENAPEENSDNEVVLSDEAKKEADEKEETKNKPKDREKVTPTEAPADVEVTAQDGRMNVLQFRAEVSTLPIDKVVPYFKKMYDEKKLKDAKACYKELVRLGYSAELISAGLHLK